MKKLFLFLALGSSIAFTSCSKDNDSPNDGDEIVGVWVDIYESSDSQGNTNFIDTYKFNGNNTGKYSYTVSGEIEEEDAFTWNKVVDKYILKYGGDDNDIEVYTIGENDGKKVLIDEDDNIEATKE